jgi:hypothetical protein
MAKKTSKLKKTDNPAFLNQLGMNQKLVTKLDISQIKNLSAFAMDHIKDGDLLQMLIQLASLEMREKKGAIVLAANSIATIIQLKSLTPAQVLKLMEIYELDRNEAITRRHLKKMLIENQQEKLYFKSGGVKGEYYLYRNEKDQDEEII